MVMNVCGIKEHEFQVSLNKKILVIASILTLIFDIFSGGVFLRQHGMGLFSVVKKLDHFEIPRGYCYSPLDGGIICVCRLSYDHIYARK